MDDSMVQLSLGADLDGRVMDQLKDMYFGRKVKIIFQGHTLSLLAPTLNPFVIWPMSSWWELTSL